MANFFLLTSLVIIFIELFSNFSILIEQVIFFDYFYIFLFFIFFIFNFFFIKKSEVFNLNIDLITKYYILIFKTPNYLLNFIKNILKQIYIYYIYFKYKFNLDTNYIIYKILVSKLSLIWRPLFKKFSYFGYYRSNRSKWIK